MSKVFVQSSLRIVPKEEIPKSTASLAEFKAPSIEQVYVQDPKTGISKPVITDTPDLTSEERAILEQKIKMVWRLRDETGAGLMDCKKALNSCDWDITKAIEYMKGEHKI